MLSAKLDPESGGMYLNHRPSFCIGEVFANLAEVELAIRYCRVGLNPVSIELNAIQPLTGELSIAMHRWIVVSALTACFSVVATA